MGGYMLTSDHNIYRSVVLPNVPAFSSDGEIEPSLRSQVMDVYYRFHSTSPYLPDLWLPKGKDLAWGLAHIAAEYSRLIKEEQRYG